MRLVTIIEQELNIHFANDYLIRVIKEEWDHHLAVYSVMFAGYLLSL